MQRIMELDRAIAKISNHQFLAYILSALELTIIN
jgi:hypothetical protein